jgi:Eco57I restriction-modification methylase
MTEETRLIKEQADRVSSNAHAVMDRADAGRFVTAESPFRGGLFSADFLQDSIRRMPDWVAVDANSVDRLASELRQIYERFPIAAASNESRTEDDLIWPVLKCLGWTASLRRQYLASRRREDVPDGLLFKDEGAKDEANRFLDEWKRYQFGLAIVESKRWDRPLDRRSGRPGEETTPSTQMLRYLRRVEDLTAGKLRWGILTNGARWRLCHHGARSVSEQFFELNLARVLDIPGHDEGLLALNADQRRHWLKVFLVIFARDAFLVTPSDERTFHQRALQEGQFHEERVAKSLSNLVFDRVFPELAGAIASAAPSASLQDVHEAALVLLYRLLFILYAEDRGLLPIRDSRYDEYGLRDRVRRDIGNRKDRNDTFSNSAVRYWSILNDLCRAIDAGDQSVGIPPYNGGLFDTKHTPILASVRLDDSVMADVIDALSFERTPSGRKYIDYRNLAVQQLGSIYERLLEHELFRDERQIAVRPNPFTRKASGSYYTPDDLVTLIIRETVEPLVTARLEAFRTRAEELAGNSQPESHRLGALKRLDPAERILDLKICDPAMGSGHFLVSLVDYLADQVIAAMAEAEAAVAWGDYVSPLNDRIDSIRSMIFGNAEERGWVSDPAQLDDRHIIRRMVLKRCVHGVDKNPMAVELAKVSLWLHTFTVGAPLSFLDHHLRYGDSLFGLWVRKGIDKATALGRPLLLHGPMSCAMRAATPMQIIERLSDAEIAEAHRAAEMFAEVQEMTVPLGSFLSLIHAFDWLAVKEDRVALLAFVDGRFGDPVQIALGTVDVIQGRPESTRFSDLLARARQLIREERFLHWQVAFPDVWSEWNSVERHGGFDAIIGNPPWDRMKLQQIEWFAARKREIALAQRAADRSKMIDALQSSEDPLASDYAKANERAEAAVRVARTCGDYPLLSNGDVNLYSLFVERAISLVKRDGMVGLLTPSGIASDKTAAAFFEGIATRGHLRALYDFENRRTRFGEEPFFPDVDSRFKFCAFIASPKTLGAPAKCAFFVQDISELEDPERCFPLTAQDFARVNPNTGTAPIFRSRRDADLTTAIYTRVPTLADRSSGSEVRSWPVKYSTMFHMTNDSGLFRTRRELEEKEKAYPIGPNRWRSATEEWLPLYEGKMAQAFNHRAASVVVNPRNQHRPAQPEPATLDQSKDPNWLPQPQYWVAASECGWAPDERWVLGFKEITAPTNERTFIAALFPTVAFGNKIPLLRSLAKDRGDHLLCANLNSTVFDFVTRQKIQGQTLNLFIVEQLPVIPPQRYDEQRFGDKTAAELVRESVLELTYTSFDMAPFAADMGYVAASGEAKPPFEWNERRRLMLRARLDAIFFHLYGITDREAVRYIYSTFPIVERTELEMHGRYLSRDLCLAFMSALDAGDPNANIAV